MSTQERIEICKKCPLARQTEFGIICDDRKYISPDGRHASFFKKEGWVRGCGCICAKKAANPNNHCVAKLW